MANDAKIQIRAWSAQDLSLLERLLGDPKMTEHLGGPETPEQIQNRHLKYCKDEHVFVIVSKGVSAGWVGYWERTWRDEQVWETGWSVLPVYQGQGVATKGVNALLEYARAEQKHRFIHAFPSSNNLPSSTIRRKAGFILMGETEFEYPPGHLMKCNDWRFDLKG
jgi:RimJ/RimL family protein N-acetyltransferase